MAKMNNASTETVMNGPWSIDRSLSGSVRCIKDCHETPVCYGDIGTPQANLIAAAPELLEALQAADVYLSHMPNDIAKDLLVIAIRASIKKARGE
jgi:hypothetical protein